MVSIWLFYENHNTKYGLILNVSACSFCTIFITLKPLTITSLQFCWFTVLSTHSKFIAWLAQNERSWQLTAFFLRLTIYRKLASLDTHGGFLCPDWGPIRNHNQMGEGYLAKKPYTVHCIIYTRSALIQMNYLNVTRFCVPLKMAFGKSRHIFYFSRIEYIASVRWSFLDMFEVVNHNLERIKLLQSSLRHNHQQFRPKYDRKLMYTNLDRKNLTVYIVLTSIGGEIINHCLLYQTRTSQA